MVAGVGADDAGAHQCNRENDRDGCVVASGAIPAQDSEVEEAANHP